MKKRLFFSLIFFVRVALATVVPLVLLVIPGVIIDKKVQLFPSLTIAALVIAIPVSIILIRKIARSAVKDIQKLY